MISVSPTNPNPKPDTIIFLCVCYKTVCGPKKNPGVYEKLSRSFFVNVWLRRESEFLVICVSYKIICVVLLYNG